MYWRIGSAFNTDVSLTLLQQPLAAWRKSDNEPPTFNACTYVTEQKG